MTITSFFIPPLSFPETGNSDLDKELQNLAIWARQLNQAVSNGQGDIPSSAVNDVVTVTEVVNVVGANVDLDDLQDVSVPGPSDGVNLTFNGTNSLWEAVLPALSLLSDVTIVSASGSLVGGLEFDNIGFGIRVFEIGTWNMDANTSPTAVAHGMGSDMPSRTVFVGAVIVDDSEAITRCSWYNFNGLSEVSVSTTNITCQRVASGSYDNTSYNSTSINRGHYFLVYLLS